MIESQKQAMIILLNTTNLLPQYPNVEREVTANGVWTVAPTIPFAISVSLDLETKLGPHSMALAARRCAPSRTISVKCLPVMTTATKTPPRKIARQLSHHVNPSVTKLATVAHVAG